MSYASQVLEGLDEKRGSYRLRERIQQAGLRRALEVQLAALEALGEVGGPARSVRALTIVIDLFRDE